MEAIEGARYSFRSSGLLIIAKRTSKFKIVPGMLANVAKIPVVVVSVTVKKRFLGLSNMMLATRQHTSSSKYHCFLMC
jgi:hypothetical protein